jgi:hypothetical protein
MRKSATELEIQPLGWEIQQKERFWKKKKGNLEDANLNKLNQKLSGKHKDRLNQV